MSSGKEIKERKPRGKTGVGKFSRVPFSQFASTDEHPQRTDKLKDLVVFAKKSSKKVDLVSVESGDIVGYRDVIEDKGFILADNKKFTKVFDEIMEVLPEMKSVELKVLMYIWHHLGRNRDELTINIDKAKKELGYKSASSVYLGLIGLLEKKVIFRGTGIHRYFINVEMFFNGKRIYLEQAKELLDRSNGED